MTTTSKLVTAEELFAMGESKYLELFDGELRTVSPANVRHGDIAGQIAMLLRQYVNPRKLGRVVVEGGFVLRRNPDTVLGPDVSFVAQARIPAAGLPEKFFEGCPDLAVEIISPTNSRAEIEEKMQRYIDGGTSLGWLVDGAAESVQVFRPQSAPQALVRSGIISGDPIITGFSVAVAELFA